MIIRLCISMSGTASKLSRKAKIPAGSTPWDSGELRGSGLALIALSLERDHHHLAVVTCTSRWSQLTQRAIKGRGVHRERLREWSGGEFASAVRKRPGEGVQDHAEPELELVPEVVAGFQYVLGGHLNEVGVRGGRKLLQHGFGNIGEGLRALERQRYLLQRESVNVAVEQGIGVGRHLDRETGPPQSSNGRVVVAHRSRARPFSRFHKADGPGVVPEHLAGGV